MFFPFWGELSAPKKGQLSHCTVMQNLWLLDSLFPTQELAAVSCYSENYCGIAAGGREGCSSQRCQCCWAVADWRNISGPKWFLRGLSISPLRMTYLIQSMFTRPLLSLYLIAVIYPTVSGSALALADTILFCSQFTFKRNFLNPFAKGYFCISLCVKCSSFFSYTCCD